MPQFNSTELDIMWIIREGLVDKHVEPNLTYINVDELREIFPGIRGLAAILNKLGYGYITNLDGKTAWYGLNNNIWRIFWDDGSYDYYKNDALHREDGPATYDASDDTYDYYIDDELIATERGGHTEIIDQEVWNEYFEGKELIKEEVSNTLLTDLQMIIDEKLVDIEVYPDLTYLYFNDLREIFPNEGTDDISNAINKLGYGYYADDVLLGDFRKYVFNGNFHNINGPAYRDEGSVEWRVGGARVAYKIGEQDVFIWKKNLWNEYFR